MKFTENWSVDFSAIHKDKLRDVTRLRDQDWSHVHITERALTFDGVTYSLNKELSSPMELPEAYFGENIEEEKEANEEEAKNQEKEDSDSESASDDEDED